MASAINKITGQHIKRGIAYDADMGADWIINPTQQQVDDIITAVNTPTPEQIKEKAIKDKDDETRAILTSGYEVAQGKTMSTSVEAQIKWNALINALNLGYSPSFPYPISLTDGDVYYVNNEDDLKQLYLDAFVAKNETYIQKLNERKAIKDNS